MVKQEQSRVRVTAFGGLAITGRALDSSPNSSPSGPIRHRAPIGSHRVRIEARDEPQETTPTAKAKAKAKTLMKEKTKTKTP
jgi:hypothetical protein